MTKVTKRQYLSDNELLSSEWNWERNSDALFSQLPLGSHKKVWWKCKEGHEWEAPVKDCSAGRGCPYCAGRKVLIGYNDLQTINPALAREWNYITTSRLNPRLFPISRYVSPFACLCSIIPAISSTFVYFLVIHNTSCRSFHSTTGGVFFLLSVLLGTVQAPRAGIHLGDYSPSSATMASRPAR